ncbi:LacI family DNA-binding transcriptional regulator [Aestuariivirga sp.]|uniref:LacI family DNA-binding transcriptional regulator n=1 Tax=Aestuariivirga sp. TaxID=2650926 RepID=UPI0039E409E7
MARLARVSPITVSRALRNPQIVSEELRSRIDNAVKKLGYVPNIAASRLASARSHAIGVIVPTLYNVIFSEYLQALHEVFLPVGFQVVVVNSRYSLEEEENAVRTLLGQRVEAIIVVGVNHTDLTRRLLQQSRIPVIETFQISPDPIGINIGLDQVQAGYDATCSLLQAGYRRVGFLMGNKDERATERYSGYQKAMQEAGLASPSLMKSQQQASSIALGARVMAQFKQGGFPEAVFCIDDNLALGAMQECMRLGLKVPDDIAILGFHDLEFAAFASPTLSSIATHRYDMGKLAAEQTLRLLNRGAGTGQDVIDIGYELVCRQSTPAISIPEAKA